MAKAKNKDLQELIARAKSTKRARTVWNPAPGDALAGEVVKLRWLSGKGKDDDGKPIKYCSLTVEQEDGNLVVVNAGLMLQEEMEEQGTKVGDTIAIAFHGKEKTGSGKNEIGIYSLATLRE